MVIIIGNCSYVGKNSLHPDHSHDTRMGRCPVPAFQLLDISSNSLSTGQRITYPITLKCALRCGSSRMHYLNFYWKSISTGGSYGCWWGMLWCNLSPGEYSVWIMGGCWVCWVVLPLPLGAAIPAGLWSWVITGPSWLLFCAYYTTPLLSPSSMSSYLGLAAHLR